MTALFLQPLDVLNLRGNRLFEGAGAYGEALMPPWPSIVAGAIRSRMLADAGVDLGRFGPTSRVADANLDRALGSPNEPGSFRVAAFSLGQRQNGEVAPLFAAPADLHVAKSDNAEQLEAAYLVPRAVALKTSAVLSKQPVLRSSNPSKPETGIWLTATGRQAYLEGQAVSPECLLPSSSLWKTDRRLGIALDPGKRTTRTGMLYTTDAVALCRDMGFLARIDGADDLLPRSGLVRLGGDGCGATISHENVNWGAPDWDCIASAGRFRIVLTSPGIFPNGWRPPGSDGSGQWVGPEGARAKLVAAAVPRAAVISGWDLSKRCPKPAMRVAPAGAVYWFENFQGHIGALCKLAEQGFWACMREDDTDASRRAEGFNHVMVAAWPEEHHAE